MLKSKASLLRAGVSVLALGVVAPAEVHAQHIATSGFHQTAGQNLYTIPSDDTEAYAGTGNAAVASPATIGMQLVCDTNCDGAIWQSASNPGGFTTNLVDNIGIIGIGTNVQATASMSSANAVVTTAIRQQALGDSASNMLTNGGLIDVNATALDVWQGSGTASAYAAVEAGIVQIAGEYNGGGSVATVSIDNSGTIDFGAFASAAGSNARASAFMGPLITQAAFANEGGGVASAEIMNTGSLLANVTANATAYGTAIAYAQASPAINQFAQANGEGGVATVGLNNSGKIDLDANASAQGFNATAGAYMGAPIFIGAQAWGEGGVASVEITNSGDFNAAISANAVGMGGDAYALAQLTGINQTAWATGADGIASVTFENSGSIALAANAHATGMAATASASLFLGMYQRALGDGIASAEITNTGSMNFDANAHAVGTEFAEARAAAYGINQVAEAIGTNGIAIADLGNDGTIAVNAVADAIATADTTANAVAVVSALVVNGISQLAYGQASADGSIVNSGAMQFGASASAVANDSALALAVIGGGIGQYAIASGTAHASIANSGNIDMAVNAIAVGGVNASATAVAGRGVLQVAIAGETGAGTGTANISFDNSGSLAINLNGNADGDDYAFALASMGEGIFQFASAGADASVSLTNSGELAFGVEANAVGGDSATAVAVLGGGALQVAQAMGEEGNAFVSLTNSGSVNLSVDAAAVGGDAVEAIAIAEYGVGQIALGGPAGVAGVEFSNSGTLGIDVDASAIGGDTAFAVAWGGTALAQIAYADGGASAEATNSGLMRVAAEADAKGDDGDHGADATALAFAFGVAQVAVARTSIEMATLTVSGHNTDTSFSNNASGPAQLVLTNSGSLAVSADAAAIADGTATAGVGAVGVNQYVSGSIATASLTNDGDISIDATALASGDTVAVASAVATGLFQFASARDFERYYNHTSLGGGAGANVSTPAGPARVAVTNTGSLNVSANVQSSVNGSVDDAAATAAALAVAGGILQVVLGATGSAIVDNSGSLTIDAAAAATGAGEDSLALAYSFGTGIAQDGLANELKTTTSMILTDSGSWMISWNHWQAPVGEIHQSVTNSGTVSVGTKATSTGGSVGGAMASASGIRQGGRGQTFSLMTENGGELDVRAEIDVAATETAIGMGRAFGIFQNGSDVYANQGGLGEFSVANSGSIDVAVDVAAEASAMAGASALAIGLFQAGFADDISADFTNSGKLQVRASAEAAGETALAGAMALGYVAAFSNGELAVENSGVVDVAAKSVADGTTGEAYAFARGMEFDAWGVMIDFFTFAGGDLSGRIDNSGTITAAAMAAGPNSIATATGIFVQSGSNDLSITNSGSIIAIATTNGGAATANGILALNNYAGVGANPDDHLTITNDGGTIVAAISTDGGKGYQHGMAIDVANAPNPTTINLLGDGVIYGNIDIAAADEIIVGDGTTIFDGIINPAQLPDEGAAESFAAVFDGSLTIASGGTLFLRNSASNNRMYDGLSQAYVGTFNMASNATLAIEVELEAPAGPSYSQVFANTANIDGDLKVQLNGTPLIDREMLIDNVVDADILNGTFDSVHLLGYEASALLSLEAIYDGGENVDLSFHRVAFGQLGEETRNQAAVGGAIEGAYQALIAVNQATTGGNSDAFLGLAGEILRLNDAGYYDALDQLSGVQFVNYLHALRNNSAVINRFVSDQGECAISVKAVGQCNDHDDGARFWTMGTYNDASLDSNGTAIGYKAENWSLLFGGDYSWGNLTVGAFAGPRKLEVDFPDAFGSHIDTDGWQIGVTGGYDVGNYYIRGVASYSTMRGDAERQIVIGSVTGTITGEPDTDVWSIYGEAGGRFQFSGSWLTPFVGVDHTSIHLNGFTETGVAGADLDFDSQTASQTSGIVGLKWAGSWGGIVPEAKIAYRYDLTEGNMGMHARFADAPVGSDFHKLENRDRGSFLAGLGLASNFSDKISGGLGYQGRFNTEAADHALYGALTIHLGGGKSTASPASPLVE